MSIKRILFKVGLPAIVLATASVGFASAGAGSNYGNSGGDNNHGKCDSGHSVTFDSADNKGDNKDGNKDCNNDHKGDFTFSLTGVGTCQDDGSFAIVWTVDNSGQKKDLTITDSSNPSVVPDSTVVTGGSSSDFNQTADGTAAGDTTLTLTGNWGNAKHEDTETGTVTLETACTQPTTPPVTPPVTPPTTPTTTTSASTVPNTPVVTPTVPGFSGK